MEFKEALAAKKEAFDIMIDDFLPEQFSVHNKVVTDAMRYSLKAGGKRIRPTIMREIFHMYNSDDTLIAPFAMAIEMIHTYSLIHDDLPAMDDDDLRRGKPTCHIQYGEAIAILAGDALLNLAFEIVHNHARKLPTVPIIEGIWELSKASGGRGMIGGQVADILNEKIDVSLELLNFINLHKTSALIEAAFVIGAIIGGASNDDVEILRGVGRNIGLAFQIQDDLLDVIGNEEELGKPVKSDEKNEKNTYVTLIGKKASQDEMLRLYDEAKEKLLEISKENTGFLIRLIDALKARRY